MVGMSLPFWSPAPGERYESGGDGMDTLHTLCDELLRDGWEPLSGITAPAGPVRRFRRAVRSLSSPARAHHGTCQVQAKRRYLAHRAS